MKEEGKWRKIDGVFIFLDNCLLVVVLHELCNLVSECLRGWCSRVSVVI